MIDLGDSSKFNKAPLYAALALSRGLRVPLKMEFGMPNSVLATTKQSFLFSAGQFLLNIFPVSLLTMTQQKW